MTVLLLADHDNKTLSGIVAKAMSAAKALGQDVHVLVAGTDCKAAAEAATKLEGASKVLHADAPQLGHQLAETALAPRIDCGVGQRLEGDETVEAVLAEMGAPSGWDGYTPLAVHLHQVCG